jgi:hypothetical protein
MAAGRSNMPTIHTRERLKCNLKNVTSDPDANSLISEAPSSDCLAGHAVALHPWAR